MPTVAEEAVRDLCRTCADMVIDQTRARHRVGKFLLHPTRPQRPPAVDAHRLRQGLGQGAGQELQSSWWSASSRRAGRRRYWRRRLSGRSSS